jgi:all-trans-retinol dehydrogenase (NAD+)
MEFVGKRILITGAGHGLGRALAHEFAHAGAEVVVTDMDATRVEAVVAELRTLGRSATGYQLNVTSTEQVLSVRDQVHATSGPIDVLVNNAGIVSGGPFLEVPLDRHLSTVNVNLSGLLAVTHAFLPDLIGRAEARLVNIASASAVLALPLATTYAATKWAVLGFSDSLREELRLAGHHHVRISTICPSYMATGLFDGARPPLLTRLLTPERVARVVHRAAKGGREFVMLPWTARFLYATAGLLPRGLFVRVCRLLGVSESMSQWRGHAPPSDGKQRLA